MPDESSELIGGISVSVGASNRRLEADLAEANRLLDAWAKQHIQVNIGASFAGGAAAGGGAARAQQAPSVSVGPGAATRAQSQQAQTALQRAINAELAKTGEAYNAITGEIESATGAATKQRTIIASIQQEASRPVDLNIDTSDLRKELDGILATLKDVVAEAKSLSQVNLATGGDGGDGEPGVGGGGGGRRGMRRKNIRDRAIGTEAASNRIYTFDPEVYAEQEKAQNARAARQRELAVASENARTDKQIAQQRANDLKAVNAEEKRARDRNLKELTYEAESTGQNNPALASGTFAPGRNGAPPPRGGGEPAEPFTPQQQAQLEERRARATAQPARIRSQAAREAAVVEKAIRADQARDEEVFAKTQVSNEDARERRLQQRVAQQRANIAAAARTSRTEASGLSALFGGTQGKLIEANARLAASERAVTEAQRNAEPFRRRIAEYDEDIATSSGKVAVARKASRESFIADPKTAAALKAEADALKEQEGALANLNKLSGTGSIARNLAAITLGGAAFGLALKGIDVAVGLIGQGFAQTGSEITNFAGISAQVTDALAKSTRQAQGNVDAVLAQTQAYDGLSAAAASVINPLVKQRTEIVAGTQAFSDLVDQFQNYQAISRQGGPGTALTRETGGPGGIGAFGQHSAEQELRRLVSGLPEAGKQAGDVLTPGYVNRATGPIRATADTVAEALGETTDAVEVLNAQLKRGGENVLKFSTAAQLGATEFNRSLKALSDAGFGQLAQELRRSGVSIGGVQGGADFQRVLKALTAGNLAPDPDLLRQQFDRQRQANIRAVGRQAEFAIGTQLPARAALANLAQPLLPPGTGIVGRNAEEQQRIVAGEREARDLQDDLNAKYKEGRQVLIQTYQPAIAKNFGDAAATAFSTAIGQIQAIGQEIAQAQAQVSNEQAAYQVAQFNYQLMIARRTLADIGGLTGKNFGAGESYLGVLERQNLALSRQAQLLQFALAQRQINFNVAKAGFEVPGVTPEERQANVKEAQIEASFAQKQLDIQRQMFGNQVQIVDIQNLRAGADLARQINLLLQGRQVTIDTAQAEERIALLQKKQALLVEQVGTYMSSVDNLAASAMSEIQQLETAAGKALTSAGTQAILSVYGFYKNLTQMFTGALPGGGAGGTQTKKQFAGGGVFDTLAPTSIGRNGVMGEAKGEKLLILSNPTPIPGGGMGGGNYFITNINNPSVRNDGDIDEIVRKVTAAQGRQASLIGLRGTN